MDELYETLTQIKFFSDLARIDLLNTNTNMFEKTLLRNSIG